MNYFSSDDSFESSSASDDEVDSLDNLSGSDVEVETIQIIKKTMKRNGAIANIFGMYYEGTFIQKK